MTKTSRRLFAAFLTGALVFAAAAAVVLFLGLTRTFDGTIRHFTAGSPYLPALIVLLALGGALAVAAGFVFRRRAFTSPLPETSLFHVFTSALVACLLAASAVFDLLEASRVATSVPASTAGVYPLLLRIRAVTALLAVPYPVLTVLRLRALPDAALRAASLFPPLWCLVMTLSQYFNSLQAINDPTKSLLLLLGVTFLFGFMAECRARFHRETPGALALFLLAPLGVGGGIVLPALVLAIIGSDAFGLSLMNAALYTAVWLLTLARALMLPGAYRQATESGKVTPEGGTHEQNA